MKKSLPFAFYNKYIIQVHMFEKIISYFVLENMDYLSAVDFEQITLHYTKGSIKYLKERSLFLHLLHAFFLEKIACAKPAYCSAYKSISEFNISCGQLMGYTIKLRHENMYNFAYNYFYHVASFEKKFNGLIFLSDNLGTDCLNFTINNLYIFPQINQLFEYINDFIPTFQSNININVFFSTKNVWLILLYLSHLQAAIYPSYYVRNFMGESYGMLSF